MCIGMLLLLCVQRLLCVVQPYTCIITRSVISPRCTLVRRRGPHRMPHKPTSQKKKKRLSGSIATMMQRFCSLHGCSDRGRKKRKKEGKSGLSGRLPQKSGEVEAVMAVGEPVGWPAEIRVKVGALFFQSWGPVGCAAGMYGRGEPCLVVGVWMEGDEGGVFFFWGMEE
ncbi:hypothetical protein IWX92DRAFT_356618 [Phyllosticta citricarpa]